MGRWLACLAVQKIVSSFWGSDSCKGSLWKKYPKNSRYKKFFKGMAVTLNISATVVKSGALDIESSFDSNPSKMRD